MSFKAIMENLPGIGAFIVTMGTLWFSNRKSRADTKVIAAGTAKTEAEIFEGKFNLLITTLERRVEVAEKRADEAERREREIESRLDDCSKQLTTISRRGDKPV